MTTDELIAELTAIADKYRRPGYMSSDVCFANALDPIIKRLELVATQVSPPTELGVCECGHGEGLHKFNYKNEPKQYRYDCRGCACENYRPKVSPPTPMARLQGALRGEETDEQFDAAVNGIRAPAPTSRWAEDAETPQPVQKIELHRCTICGTRWLLWPDAIHGGGWNLLDKWQRPGLCCNNVAMGDQIEHLRDFELRAEISSPARPQVSNYVTESASRFKKFFVPVTYESRDGDTLAVRMCKKIYNLTALAKFHDTPIGPDELRAINSAAFAGLEGDDEIEGAASPATPALKELIKQWRASADWMMGSTSPDEWQRGSSAYLRACANELEKALADVARLPASQEEK